MANGISGSLVDSASSYSAAVFQDFIKLLINDRDTLVLQDGQTQANFAVYPISIDFDQLPKRDRGGTAATGSGQGHRNKLDAEARRREASLDAARRRTVMAAPMLPPADV